MLRNRRVKNALLAAIWLFVSAIALTLSFSLYDTFPNHVLPLWYLAQIAGAAILIIGVTFKKGYAIFIGLVIGGFPSYHFSP